MFDRDLLDARGHGRNRHNQGSLCNAKYPTVMVGLGPAIHAFTDGATTWMRGSSPRMTAISGQLPAVT
jgi:hypothetical protein